MFCFQNPKDTVHLSKPSPKPYHSLRTLGHAWNMRAEFTGICFQFNRESNVECYESISLVSPLGKSTWNSSTWRGRLKHQKSCRLEYSLSNWDPVYIGLTIECGRKYKCARQREHWSFPDHRSCESRGIRRGLVCLQLIECVVAWPVTSMFFRSSLECGRKSRKTSGNFPFKCSEQKLSSCLCWPI